MSWGGLREGAGRKRDPIRTTAIAKRIVDKMKATGNMGPLDFLVDIAADVDQPVALRIDCAKAACPYLYPKLQSIAVQQDDDANKLVVVLQSFSANGTAVISEHKPPLPLPVIGALASDDGDENDA